MPQPDFDFSITVVNGTSMMPWPSRALIHAPIRSIEIGSAEAVPTSVEIDRALARLEGLAREHGTAVGMASALPVSIERIGIWAKALESRGILLVPLTTVMLKSKSG